MTGVATRRSSTTWPTARHTRRPAPHLSPCWIVSVIVPARNAAASVVRSRSRPVTEARYIPMGWRVSEPRRRSSRLPRRRGRAAWALLWRGSGRAARGASRVGRSASRSGATAWSIRAHRHETSETPGGAFRPARAMALLADPGTALPYAGSTPTTSGRTTRTLRGPTASSSRGARRRRLGEPGSTCGSRIRRAAPDGENDLFAPRVQKWQSRIWSCATAPFRRVGSGDATRSVPTRVASRGPLAQLAEQRTFNPRVVGSSPTGPTGRDRVCSRVDVLGRCSPPPTRLS
jgi:hypothetical protein